MKKSLALTLALALCLALAAPALAAGDQVVLSPQALVFDGYGVEEFGAYNINGYNYFKLRDIAALMSGTAGQFAVDYNNETRTVSVTTGGSYVWVGGELEKRADQSASAQPSSQSILIDGEKVDTLSVYNIGGNNYFKLRDLGEALGFSVDYDEDWNAAIVAPPRTEWVTVKETHTTEDGTVTITFTYDANGRCTGYAASDGSTNSVSVYNDYGVVVSAKSWGGEGEDAWRMETSYNGRGAVLSEGNSYSFSEDKSEYSYSARGVLLREYSESSSDWCTMTHENLYNEQGLLTQTTNTSAWDDSTGETAVTDYTYDAQGRTVAYQTKGSGTSIGYDWDENGEIISVSEPYSFTAESRTVYEADRSTETVRYTYTYADGSQSVTDSVGVTVYDANGSVLSRKDTNVIDGETSVSECRYTYDEAGRLLTEAEYYGSDTPDTVETYTYDAAGRMISDRREYSYGGYSVMSYTYDDKGNCIADSYEERRSEYDWESDVTVTVIERRSSTTEYNDAGQPVCFISDTDGLHYVRTLTYDEYGNLIRELATANGEVIEDISYVWQRT